MKTLLYFLVLVGSAANAAVVTFEEFSLGDGPSATDDWIQSNGYEFTGTAWPGPFPDGDMATIFIGDSGSKSFGASSAAPGLDSFGSTVTVAMRKTDGGAFAVNSLDLVLMSDSYTGSTSITGTLAGGGAANLSVAVGTGDWLNLELVQFNANGDGFGFGYAAIELDNINVSAVPIPAAVWLFGSALAGLGWMRRRKTV